MSRREVWSVVGVGITVDHGHGGSRYDFVEDRLDHEVPLLRTGDLGRRLHLHRVCDEVRGPAVLLEPPAPVLRVSLQVLADTVDHKSKASEYASRAQRFMRMANELLPLREQGEIAAAGGETSWGDQVGLLTHPQR